MEKRGPDDEKYDDRRYTCSDHNRLAAPVLIPASRHRITANVSWRSAENKNE